MNERIIRSLKGGAVVLLCLVGIFLLIWFVKIGLPYLFSFNDCGSSGPGPTSSRCECAGYIARDPTESGDLDSTMEFVCVGIKHGTGSIG